MSAYSQSIEFDIVDFMTQISNKHDAFIKTIEPYKNCEYIPFTLIIRILETTMPSFQNIHEFSPEHFVIKVKICDLLESPICNWIHNRPPDLVRCHDIAKSIYTSRNPVDTMFYIVYNNIKQTFEIIDGIHRFTALQIICKENKQPTNFLCPNDFGGNNDADWLFESYVLVNIRFNATLGSIIETFTNLNKSNPIPDLYIRNVSEEKKRIIHEVANKLQVKYSPHFSSSSKPNKPNVNRDRFIDLLEHVYDKYKVREETKYVLEKLLDHANTNIRRNLPNKITKSCLDKCNETGCFLFLYTLEELEKKI